MPGLKGTTADNDAAGLSSDVDGPRVAVRLRLDELYQLVLSRQDDLSLLDPVSPSFAVVARELGEVTEILHKARAPKEEPKSEPVQKKKTTKRAVAKGSPKRAEPAKQEAVSGR